MTAFPVLVDRQPDGVVHVRLNRPDILNAFDEAMIAALDETFASLGADPQVRVIVLSAAGRSFCAGADIAWMRRAAANSEQANLADARAFASMMNSVASCPKPVVARIQGGAFGGGVGLACAADIAIATRDAVFSVSEARFGIIPAVIGPYVVNAVGRRQAQRLALTAERVDARAALDMGLLAMVCDDDVALDKAVEAITRSLIANGPVAQSEIKKVFAGLSRGPVTPEVRELTAQTISRIRATAEAREGFAAFVEKRPANWTTGR